MRTSSMGGAANGPSDRCVVAGEASSVSAVAASAATAPAVVLRNDRRSMRGFYPSECDSVSVLAGPRMELMRTASTLFEDALQPFRQVPLDRFRRFFLGLVAQRACR